MEIIRGKKTSFLPTLVDHAAGYDAVHIDLGTGDGRFVQHVAQTRPNTLVIGLDAARENLHEVSRRAPANALFVIANALALPCELDGWATHITIKSAATGAVMPVRGTAAFFQKRKKPP